MHLAEREILPQGMIYYCSNTKLGTDFFNGFVEQLWANQALLFLRVNDKGGAFYATHFLSVLLISQQVSSGSTHQHVAC